MIKTMFDKTELFYFQDHNGTTKIGEHSRVSPSTTARFAMDMIARWAAVAGKGDGLTADGSHQKIANQSPEEIVQHCCDVAERAFKEFEERGWFKDIPSYEECRELARKEREKN